MVVAMELKTVLVKVSSQMGYTELRPKQKEVILDFVRGVMFSYKVSHRERQVRLPRPTARGV